jgi:MFS family permease
MLSWGWRLPFLASVVLLVVGWFIRSKVSESPVFQKMADRGTRVDRPVTVVLRTYPKELLVTVGARLAVVTWFYTVVTFALAYATGTLGVSRVMMLNATTWGALVALFTMPLFGILGDRLGCKWIFMSGAAGILVFASVFFSMLQTQDSAYVILAMMIAIGLIYASLYGPEAALFSAQYPPEVRYSGISIAAQVSGAIGGGLAPLVATSLLAYGNGDPHYIVWYLSGLAVLAITSAAFMRGPRG